MRTICEIIVLATCRGGLMKKEIAKQLALGIALNCVRNTSIENIHAGIVPKSTTPDGSDVFIKTETNNIPWNAVSRITDEEMKTLMIEVVNKVYTVLINLDDPTFLEEFVLYAGRSTIGWNEPEYLENWFKKK